MADIIKWGKDKSLQKATFDRFVREVASQARKLEVEQRVSAAQNSDSHYREQSTERPRKNSDHLILKNNHRDIANMLTPQRNKKSEQRGINRRMYSEEFPLCIDTRFLREEGKRLP